MVARGTKFETLENQQSNNNLNKNKLFMNTDLFFWWAQEI